MYRVGFRVEQEEYQGPLTLEITGPRDGFGKQLIHSETLVRPHTPYKLHIDTMGNRWVRVNYSKIRYREAIRFHFAFKYITDMTTLLDHDLMLLEQSRDGPMPEAVHPFLNSGYKIDTNLPQAVEWAKEGVSGPPFNVRLEYQRLTKFMKDTIAYDTHKRNQYFGGRAIYSDLDDMYQEVTSVKNELTFIQENLELTGATLSGTDETKVALQQRIDELNGQLNNLQASIKRLEDAAR